MSMFIIGRHTRAEEESGRDELVRAAAIGRQAPMTAAVVDAMLANVALGALRRPQPGDVPARDGGLDRPRRGPDAERLGVHRHRPDRGAAHGQHPLHVRHRRRGDRRRLRAARRRRRRRERPELALADRVVPGHARLLGPALVAGPAPAGRSRGRDVGGVRRVPAARHRLRRPGGPAGSRPRGTRAARPVRPGLAPPAGVGDRLGGRAVPHGAGLRLDRRRRRRPGRRLGDHPGGVPAGRRPTWSRASTRPRC